MVRKTSIILLFILTVLSILSTSHLTDAEADALQDPNRHGNPNEIDTVYFTVQADGWTLDSNGILMTFWARNCKDCRRTGLITSSTILFDALDNQIPIRTLRRNKRFEAVAVLYQKHSNVHLESIYLAE